MASERGLSRKNSGNLMKEKIVKYYECVFQAANPCDSNRNFWNEFFLLRANLDALENQFSLLSSAQLFNAKTNINQLFVQSIKCMEDKNSIKTVNAIQTLTGLVKGGFSKSKGDYGFQVIDLLVGFDEAETTMQRLIEQLQSILISRISSVSLKNLCLRFLLAMVTVTDNVSQNTMLEYLMINSIFDALLLILTEPNMRKHHGNDAVIILMLLVQYRKYESTNPYIVNLSILDNDIALNGLSQIIALSLLGYNRQYTNKINQQKPAGIMSSFTSMVGSMFSSEDTPKVKMKPDIPLLLALYEAIHLNRNFVLALTTSHASDLGPAKANPESEQTTPAIPRTSEAPLACDNLSLEQPTNLLATFIEYTSIIFHDVREKDSFNVSKLCLIILNCVAEDQYACSLMHDASIGLRVPIHRLPMRHRKLPPEINPPSQPLAICTLDLLVEFMISHMMKSLPAELYLLSLNIIHKLIVYQKKSRVRLSYDWKQLWAALTNLVKFLLNNESSLLKICNIFHIAHKVIDVFNMFITYGDMFLASPQSYDELYYELIRTRSTFDNLYSVGLRYSADEQWKEDSTNVLNSLGNIRAVVNHFNPKVESWAAVNHLASLTEDQVLEVVRTNYDTLTLKVHETLDQYERYSEKPKHIKFFLQMVRSLIVDIREKAIISKLEQTSLLKEFSMLSPS